MEFFALDELEIPVSMLTAQTPIGTRADLVERLGGVPLERIRLFPHPGTATEEDVVRIEQQENRLCELVAGVLVEKAIGFGESLLAVAIASALRAFVTRSNLGLVTGEGDTLDGAPVLPGFTLDLKQLFAELDRCPND